MKRTTHTDAALRFLEEASRALTQAVGAMVTVHRESPELHERTIAVSMEVDQLLSDLEDAIEP